MSAHLVPVCAWHIWKAKEGVRSPATVVKDGNEPPRGYWGSNPSPLQELVRSTTELCRLLPALVMCFEAVSCRPGCLPTPSKTLNS